MAISRQYNCKPSQVFPEMDEYTAFCFDEACTYIQLQMQDDKKPYFRKIDKETKLETKHFKSASDLYKSMGYGYGAYKKNI